MPEIYIVSDSIDIGYQGMFSHPDEDHPRGYIEVVDNEYYESTLAHELRHAWQLLKYGDGDGVDFNVDIPYEDAIRQYFRDPFEFDSLRFEYKYARNDLNSYWMDIVNERV